MPAKYQRQVWRENERDLIRILNKESLTFTELIKKSGLSRSVINQHLKDLEARGMICKQYEKGKILNVLRTEKVPESNLFVSNVRPYVLGGMELLETKNSKTTPDKVVFEMKFEEPNLNKRVALIGRRLGAFYLFSLLKAIEKKDLVWLQDANFILNYDTFLEAALELYSKTRTQIKEVGNDLLMNTVVACAPEEDSMKRFRDIFKQAYPEEFAAFEKTLNQKE